MYQAIGTVLGKSASLLTGNRKLGAPAAPHRRAAPFALLRGRRADDLFVIAIGVLLTLLFFAQFAWLMLSGPHS
jgi:hypothetical protein